MPLCLSCNESVPPGMELCPLCGNAVSNNSTSGTLLEALPMDDVIEGIPIAEARRCSLCDRSYDALYADEYCECGGELVDAPATEAFADPSLDATRTERLHEPIVEQSSLESRRLVLYGEDKNPITHFAVSKDVTLIGRLDPVEGVFPDIDLGEWVDERNARRVSRKHALVIQSRHDDSVCLRPLPGNTGTQIEGELVEPMTDHLLQPGLRIILGGAVRLKYEDTEK